MEKFELFNFAEEHNWNVTHKVLCIKYYIHTHTLSTRSQMKFIMKMPFLYPPSSSFLYLCSSHALRHNLPHRNSLEKESTTNLENRHVFVSFFCANSNLVRSVQCAKSIIPMCRKRGLMGK